jgi:hypothetical protein
MATNTVAKKFKVRTKFITNIIKPMNIGKILFLLKAIRNIFSTSFQLGKNNFMAFN